MALTKTLKPSKTTTSIIKTRSQARTGTTPRTTATTGRTTGTNLTIDTDVPPAPVTDDLFADRPKTGTLKDAPPARDRDLDRL